LSIVRRVVGTANTVINVFAEMGSIGIGRIADFKAELPTAEEARIEVSEILRDDVKASHKVQCLDWIKESLPVLPGRLLEYTRPPIGFPR